MEVKVPVVELVVVGVKMGVGVEVLTGVLVEVKVGVFVGGIAVWVLVAV